MVTPREPWGLSLGALAGGTGHTCGLTSAGETCCWGDGHYGRLGRGSFGHSPVPVAVAP